MTVVIAFIANILVAIAKSVAAVVTGSASMVAEAAHSWADAGNEIFLLIADRRSARPKDSRHPLGFGREAYVWSMFAAVGIFTAGAVFSIMHGLQELSNPAPVESPGIAFLILGLAFLIEGTSFTQAVVQARRKAQAQGTSTFELVLRTSNTTLRAVVAEDFAALIGLLAAGTGIYLHQVTGDARWDAAGSIVIGVLLAVVALVLIDRNRLFLIGASSTPEIRARVGRALQRHREIERVTYLHLEYIGPDRLFLVAEVDLVGNDPEEDVARQMRRLERELEAHEGIETAVLSLSVSDEASLEF
ncbi:MAG: cation diffusion facilitator family transporter [Arthrobacter sp.]|uniref:cation diffusion facilitator family transporter n=1 Tax=unclassified Arthrobacter TaxID=235627 RepID=UPI00264C8603|nr:cation diffusion facilitator family transporter [Micrococcaceae bacterium]MDN5824775.1 cation diffusion facilitator family transporter [Micrococcaceae bacterium]MDN5878350.1 cation diffusion facilitator family transporter [Micrococcaceae bacterium]MDN5885935.1 cation diffusion facilitator family transporter [Micrococcaceae bacterium]MDN5904668.1 cation diffusion facilitator family transporter [Micrococcaceae bacterium]